MLFNDDQTCRTYYDILGAKEDASYEELRTSYRSAILSCHPDKLQNTSVASFQSQESQEKFLEVQRAWEVLGNSRSRAAYDNELQELRQDAVAAEDVSLEDLTVKSAGEILVLFYQCRCGDHFSIDSSELADMGCQLLRDGNKISLHMLDAVPSSVLLSCGSCTHRVCILLNSEMELQTNDSSKVTDDHP